MTKVRLANWISFLFLVWIACVSANVLAAEPAAEVLTDGSGKAWPSLPTAALCTWGQPPQTRFALCQGGAEPVIYSPFVVQVKPDGGLDDAQPAACDENRLWVPNKGSQLDRPFVGFAMCGANVSGSPFVGSGAVLDFTWGAGAASVKEVWDDTLAIYAQLRPVEAVWRHMIHGPYEGGGAVDVLVPGTQLAPKDYENWDPENASAGPGGMVVKDQVHLPCGKLYTKSDPSVVCSVTCRAGELTFDDNSCKAFSALLKEKTTIELGLFPFQDLKLNGATAPYSGYLAQVEFEFAPPGKPPVPPPTWAIGLLVGILVLAVVLSVTFVIWWRKDRMKSQMRSALSGDAQTMWERLSDKQRATLMDLAGDDQRQFEISAPPRWKVRRLEDTHDLLPQAWESLAAACYDGEGRRKMAPEPAIDLISRYILSNILQQKPGKFRDGLDLNVIDVLAAFASRSHIRKALGTQTDMSPAFLVRALARLVRRYAPSDGQSSNEPPPRSKGNFGRKAHTPEIILEDQELEPDEAQPLGGQTGEVMHAPGPVAQPAPLPQPPAPVAPTTFVLPESVTSTLGDISRRLDVLSSDLLSIKTNLFQLSTVKEDLVVARTELSEVKKLVLAIRAENYGPSLLADLGILATKTDAAAAAVQEGNKAIAAALGTSRLSLDTIQADAKLLADDYRQKQQQAQDIQRQKDQVFVRPEVSGLLRQVEQVLRRPGYLQAVGGLEALVEGAPQGGLEGVCAYLLAASQDLEQAAERGAIATTSYLEVWRGMRAMLERGMATKLPLVNSMAVVVHYKDAQAAVRRIVRLKGFETQVEHGHVGLGFEYWSQTVNLGQAIERDQGASIGHTWMLNNVIQPICGPLVALQQFLYRALPVEIPEERILALSAQRNLAQLEPQVIALMATLGYTWLPVKLYEMNHRKYSAYRPKTLPMGESTIYGVPRPVAEPGIIIREQKPLLTKGPDLSGDPPSAELLILSAS